VTRLEAKNGRICFRVIVFRPPVCHFDLSEYDDLADYIVPPSHVDCFYGSGSLTFPCDQAFVREVEDFAYPKHKPWITRTWHLGLTKERPNQVSQFPACCDSLKPADRPLQKASFFSSFPASRSLPVRVPCASNQEVEGFYH
jgi:hypothetical protein